MHGALQPHHQVKDELGYGRLTGCTDLVPVTRPGDDDVTAMVTMGPWQKELRHLDTRRGGGEIKGTDPSCPPNKKGQRTLEVPYGHAFIDIQIP